LSDPTGTNGFLFQKFLSPLISPKNFLSLLLSALSFLCSLFSLCSLHLTTAHKTATPRPRLEGDPTPLATPRRRDHPSLPRWLAVEIPAGLGSPTAKPAAVACRGDPCRSGGHPRPSLLRWLAVEIPAGLGVTHGQACCGGLPWRSLPVWGSPTAKPAAVACRARSPPVWRSPTAKPAAWGRQACRLGC
jgi:hypothetical protein